MVVLFSFRGVCFNFNQISVVRVARFRIFFTILFLNFFRCVLKFRIKYSESPFQILFLFLRRFHVSYSKKRFRLFQRFSSEDLAVSLASFNFRCSYFIFIFLNKNVFDNFCFTCKCSISNMFELQMSISNHFRHFF